MAPVLGDVILGTCDFSESVSTTGFSIGLHYRITDVTSADGFDQYVSKLSDTIKDAWNLTGSTAIKALYPTTFRFNRIDWTGIDVPTDQYVYAVNIAGSAATDAYNVRSAVVSTHYTGLRGRSYRGRSFFPAPSEADVGAGGTITATAAAAILAFFTSCKTVGQTGAAASLTVYSPKLSTDTITFNNLVTSTVIRTKLGSQRRRRRVD